MLNKSPLTLPCLSADRFSKEGDKGISHFEKGGLRGILKLINIPLLCNGI
jgi:hypothetical protein